MLLFNICTWKVKDVFKCFINVLRICYWISPWRLRLNDGKTFSQLNFFILLSLCFIKFNNSSCFVNTRTKSNHWVLFFYLSIIYAWRIWLAWSTCNKNRLPSSYICGGLNFLFSNYAMRFIMAWVIIEWLVVIRRRWITIIIIISRGKFHKRNLWFLSLFRRLDFADGYTNLLLLFLFCTIIIKIILIICNWSLNFL